MTTEDVNEESTHHKLENARKYLDKVWPFFKQGEFDTQGTRSDADGQIGDIASIVVTYNDATYKRKTYKRNFGVTTDYTGRRNRSKITWQIQHSEYQKEKIRIILW